MTPRRCVPEASLSQAGIVQGLFMGSHLHFVGRIMFTAMFLKPCLRAVVQCMQTWPSLLQKEAFNCLYAMF